MEKKTMLDDVRDDMAMGEPLLTNDAIESLDRDALQKRVRDFVAQNSSSYKAVATVAGVGESTFTAWLGGKYRGDNDGIDAKIRKWLRSEEALGRRRLIMPAEVKFAPTRSAMRMMGLLEHAQAMPDVAVITGGAGVGKTTQAKHYKATHPNVWLLTAQPSISSPYAMLEYLRSVLGIAETAPHKVSHAITLKLSGTQGLIIVDEAQHLTSKSIDQLRVIYDIAEIGLVLMGNEETWSRIDGGTRKADLAQLHSRVGMRVNVPRSTAKDIDIILDHAEVADATQRQLLRQVASKPGALRAMMKTLRVARMVAAGEETDVNDQHIASAWKRLSGGEVAAL
jgi:DNA transposition AAA+ family ATPase